METNNITANDPSPASSSAQSSAPTQLQQSSPSQIEPPPESVLQNLHSYPFKTDAEFKIGLAVILGHPDTPPTEQELNRNDDLALQAKCFYYSRKKAIQPPIDFSAYKAWLSTQPLSSDPQPPQSTTSTSTSTATAATVATTDGPSPASTSATTTETEPSYPSSFAHIVELITTGQPIPGIQEIPDTVLTGKEAPSTAAKRRKPWEKGDDETADSNNCTKSKDDGQDVGK